MYSRCITQMNKQLVESDQDNFANIIFQLTLSLLKKGTRFPNHPISFMDEFKRHFDTTRSKIIKLMFEKKYGYAYCSTKICTRRNGAEVLRHIQNQITNESIEINNLHHHVRLLRTGGPPNGSIHSANE